jgi:hypothetical protein
VAGLNRQANTFFNFLWDDCDMKTIIIALLLGVLGISISARESWADAVPIIINNTGLFCGNITLNPNGFFFFGYGNYTQAGANNNTQYIFLLNIPYTPVTTASGYNTVTATLYNCALWPFGGGPTYSGSTSFVTANEIAYVDIGAVRKECSESATRSILSWYNNGPSSANVAFSITKSVTEAWSETDETTDSTTFSGSFSSGFTQGGSLDLGALSITSGNSHAISGGVSHTATTSTSLNTSGSRTDSLGVNITGIVVPPGAIFVFGHELRATEQTITVYHYDDDDFNGVADDYGSGSVVDQTTFVFKDDPHPGYVTTY